MSVGGSYELEGKEFVVACLDKNTIIEYVKWVYEVPSEFDGLLAIELWEILPGRNCGYLYGYIDILEIIYKSDRKRSINDMGSNGKMYKVNKRPHIVKLKNIDGLCFYAAIYNYVEGEATEPNILKTTD